MATANIPIAAGSALPNPPAGEATLFINTEDDNILSLKLPDGTVRRYSEANLDDCCSCEIAKNIADQIMCAFSSGIITATEFGVIMGTGISVTSTKGTDTDGNSFCKVEIGTKNIPVTGMSIDGPGSIGLLCAGSIVQLSATVLPANASNKKVKWFSSNLAVVTVDINTGLVTQTGTGSAVITAYTEDGGFTDTVNVTANSTGC